MSARAWSGAFGIGVGWARLDAQIGENDGHAHSPHQVILWEYLLGTSRVSSSDGVRAGAIGIDGRPDYPATYAAQFIEPFHKVQIRS